MSTIFADADTQTEARTTLCQTHLFRRGMSKIAMGTSGTDSAGPNP